MAYEPHTWVTKEKITAEKLNHMEQGIADASTSSGSSDSNEDVDLSQYAPLEKPRFKDGIICGIGVFEDSVEGYSIVIGNNSKATGSSSSALGVGCEATGNFSSAFGYLSKALAEGSHAEGNSTNASGTNAHAEGEETIASGNGSHAEGRGTKATGANAHAEGLDTTAKGWYSHAGGQNSIASGNTSFASGVELLASAQYQTVLGYGNIENTSMSSMLIIGNGSKDSNSELAARANCFRVTTTGVYASGDYNASGADYAELMEWEDGNRENEDRVGLFVTLVSNKIRIAKPGDKKILGIVSGNPSVVGDVYDDQWQGMYLHDIFGRPIWEDVMVPNETIEIPDPQNPSQMITEIVQPAHMEHRQKLNPNYDHMKKYIPRSERSEWDAVGMIGKLVAIDDGTCEPGGYCTVGYDDGVATYTDEETKFNVMERIDNTHIRVMIIP